MPTKPNLSYDDWAVSKKVKIVDDLIDDGNRFVTLADKFAVEYEHNCDCGHSWYQSLCPECRLQHLNNVRIETALMASKVNLSISPHDLVI